MATVRRRWPALDNTIKQIIFVIAAIFTLMYASALTLAVFAGTWAGVAAVSVILGVTLLLAGVIRLATWMYPAEREGKRP